MTWTSWTYGLICLIVVNPRFVGHTPVIKKYAKKHDYKPIKDLLRKIRYETDSAYLDKLIDIIFTDENIGVQYVEEKYEEIFRTEEEIKSEEYAIYK